MPVKHYWTLLVQDAVEAYYAHPYAWDEIGFGGPAYPRGYMRLERGQPEPWEVERAALRLGAAADGALRRAIHADGWRRRIRGEDQPAGGQGGHALKRDDCCTAPLLGGFEAPKPDEHMLGPIQKLDAPMRRYAPDEEVDVCIVGVGSAGGVLLQRLARAGFRVVGLEAGPFWDTERDWVSDEAGSHKLYWNDLRITGGENPLALRRQQQRAGRRRRLGPLGRLHAALPPLGLHASTRRTALGADWPISYWDLKPYYELLETRDARLRPGLLPLGRPARLPLRAAPDGAASATRWSTAAPRWASASASAARWRSTPARTPTARTASTAASASRAARWAPSRARWSATCPTPSATAPRSATTAWWRAINLGTDGRVTRRHLLRSASGARCEQKARLVIVCGYAIETPRLLLNSACPGFEHGLANSSGTVGKYLMAQAGNVVMGRFPDLIRMYKGPPANALTEEFYETDPRRDFVRGFAIQTVGPLPIAFAKQMMAAKGAWGWGLRRVMMDYNHWAAFGLLGEILPWEDNRVELAEEKDSYGLPVAKITFSLHDNDKKLIAFARKQDRGGHVGGRGRGGGAGGALRPPGRRGAHGQRPAHARWWTASAQSHDIPNLFICDGSILPTQGSANPGLTIQALAARTADYLIAERENVLAGKRQACGRARRPARPLAAGHVGPRRAATERALPMSSAPSYRFGVSEFTTMAMELRARCRELRRSSASIRSRSARSSSTSSAHRRAAGARRHAWPDNQLGAAGGPHPVPQPVAARAERRAGAHGAVPPDDRAHCPVCARTLPFVTNTGIPPKGNIQQVLDMAAREYRALAELRARPGVRMALEPLNAAIMNVESAIWTLEQAMRIVEAVDRDNFGICLDVWNIWQNADILEGIRRVRRPHLRGAGERLAHAPLVPGSPGRRGRARSRCRRCCGPSTRAAIAAPTAVEIFSSGDVPDSLWQADLH